MISLRVVISKAGSFFIIISFTLVFGMNGNRIYCGGVIINTSQKGVPMNTIFYNELQEKCREIQKDRNHTAMIMKVLDAYDRVMAFQKVAKKEGLLALEEACENLDSSDNTQAYFQRLIILVLDGMEPKMLQEIGMNMMIANGYTSYDGLICLMYYKTGMMIQSGENPFIIKQFMKSMLPEFILYALEKRESEAAFSKNQEEELALVKSLCENEKEMNKKEFSIINQTTMMLLVLSDKEMQRLLREIENSDVVVAMKGLPGKARACFFDNFSQRLGCMIANDIVNMGPVRLHDVEEACVTIMKTAILLEDKGELGSHDFTTMKIVIDMYESAQKENQELKETYKDLKELVDKIYKG